MQRYILRRCSVRAGVARPLHALIFLMSRLTGHPPTPTSGLTMPHERTLPSYGTRWGLIKRCRYSTGCL